jgi:hypothetical protein
MADQKVIETNGIDPIAYPIDPITGLVNPAILEQIKKPSPHAEQYGKVTLGPGGQRDLANALPPPLFALPKLTIAQRTTLEHARKYALSKSLLMKNAVQSAAALVSARFNFVPVRPPTPPG